MTNDRHYDRVWWTSHNALSTKTGDWLEDSGWCTLLTDVIASSRKAESFLNASHVSRTRYVHQVSAAAIHILMTRAYQKQSIEENNVPDFNTCRKDKESKDPQFFYWSQTLRLQQLVISFVRSIRSRDFSLYKTTIAQLLPWFFAFNHTSYARWLSVHLCDMLQLQETNPDVFNHFNEDHFIVRNQNVHFLHLASTTSMNRIINALKETEVKVFLWCLFDFSINFSRWHFTGTTIQVGVTFLIVYKK